MTIQSRDQDPSKWTESDWQAYLAEVRASLEPAKQLVEFLAKHEPEGGYTKRFPLAAVSKVMVHPGQTETIRMTPDIPVRLRHLILSDSTAESFDLVQLYVGNIGHVISFDPLPLETFSVKHYAADPERSLAVQEWWTEPITPGHVVQLVVRNVCDRARQFRGVLWADAKLW